MNTAFFKKYPEIYDHLKSIPRPEAKFIYGTAGFRMHYDLLPSVSMYHKQVKKWIEA